MIFPSKYLFFSLIFFCLTEAGLSTKEFIEEEFNFNPKEAEEEDEDELPHFEDKRKSSLSPVFPATSLRTEFQPKEVTIVDVSESESEDEKIAEEVVNMEHKVKEYEVKIADLTLKCEKSEKQAEHDAEMAEKERIRFYLIIFFSFLFKFSQKS